VRPLTGGSDMIRSAGTGDPSLHCRARTTEGKPRRFSGGEVKGRRCEVDTRSLTPNPAAVISRRNLSGLGDHDLPLHKRAQASPNQGCERWRFSHPRGQGMGVSVADWQAPSSRPGGISRELGDRHEGEAEASSNNRGPAPGHGGHDALGRFHRHARHLGQQLEQHFHMVGHGDNGRKSEGWIHPN